MTVPDFCPIIQEPCKRKRCYSYGFTDGQYATPYCGFVMRMVICPLNGWHPLSACNICEHHLGIHTNVDTLESEVSCGYIAANVCEGE